MTVGENIRNLRKQRGLTQKRLGELCNIAEPTIRKYELGKLNPKIETIQKIANALGIQIPDLLPISHVLGDAPSEVSEERPISYPGLEKKVYEIGYNILYGCDYVETSNSDIWIHCPSGEDVPISVNELEELNREVDTYLKFRLEELRSKKNTK